MTTTTVPIVDYLVLGDEPHLRAHECSSCGARYFDRRNACAACGGAAFLDVPLPTTGTVRAFTIVRFAAPGVRVPFVPAVIDCDGTTVRGNIVNTPADPAHLRLGMPVRLTTYSLGTDSGGAEAVGYGFEPTD